MPPSHEEAAPITDDPRAGGGRQVGDAGHHCAGDVLGLHNPLERGHRRDFFQRGPVATGNEIGGDRARPASSFRPAAILARPEPDRAGLPQAQAPVAKSQRIGSATHTASGFHRESRVGKFPLGLGFGARLLVALFSILAGSRVLDAIVSTIMLTLVASLIVWAVL